MFSKEFRSSLRSLLIVPLALTACAIPKILGGNPIDTDTDGGGDSSSGGTTNDQVTTGEPFVCENPDFKCSGPVDCEEWNCGAIGSSFDKNGCLRRSCVDAPCGANEVCYGVSRDENCAVFECGGGDVCECGWVSDCVGAFCIPADEGPPVECPKITEKEACLAAGCSEFDAQHSMVGKDENGDCVVKEVVPTCLWFSGDAWGGTATPGSFYNKATGLATSFATDWAEPPHGWGDCGDADAPPSCECFSLCAQAQATAEQFFEQVQPCETIADCALLDGICFEGNKCGTVGVHKDQVDDWAAIHANLMELQCCEGGADPCGSTLKCEDNRCVAVFP